MDFPTYPLFINGRDVDTGAYEYFAYADKWIVDPKATASIISEAKKGNILPETNDYIFARSCVGNEEHNNLAIESASRAFQVFGSFPLSKRIKILGDIHELLLEHKAEILRLFIAEGHPGRLGEWEFSGMLQAYEKKTVALYRSEFAKALEGRNSEKGLLIRKPDGVICFSPPRNAAASNSLTGGLTFLGGNTIVLKPPLTLPISTIFLWRNVVNEALRRNGAPSGTLNIVVGNTVKFINQWIKHPLVNDIIYFGDSKRGQELGVKIFSAGKKPILELSGKDIVVVWRDANIDAAAESLIDCFLGSTQICMVPKMALVHESIYDRFEKAFVNKVKQLKVGLPTDPNTYLSPVCQMDSYFAFLNDAIEKGAKKLCGGRRLDHRGDPSDDGPYIEPTVLRFDADEPKINLRCVNEENFFPLLPLLKVTSKSTRSRPRGLEDADEIIFRKMMEILDSNQYGLRVSAWSNSDSMIRRFVREIDGCGLLRINCRHVDFSMFMATHGGPRKTGGPYGELNYFWQKTTHLQGVTYKT